LVLLKKVDSPAPAGMVALLAVFNWGLAAFWAFDKQALSPLGEGGRACRFLVLLPVSWLVAAFWPLIGQRPFGRASLPKAGDAFIIIGTMSLPMFSAGVKALPFVGNKGYMSPQEDSLRVTTVLVLLVVSGYFGLMWKPKVWLRAAVAF